MQKAITAVLGAALVFAVPKPIQASEPQIIIVGMENCGTWLTARTQGTALALEASVQGFLNGMTVGSRKNFWRVGGNSITREQVWYWLDNYCRSNPLQTTFFGMQKLFDSRAR